LVNTIEQSDHSSPLEIPVPEVSVAPLQNLTRPTIRILVADDHPTILEMVKKILKLMMALRSLAKLETVNML
jgi:hypothetical protein